MNDNSKTTQSTKKNPPVATFKSGAILAAVWLKHTQTGLVYLEYSLERLWKSKTGGKWQSSHSFFPQHAQDVKNVVDQATEFIRANHENPEAARGGREQLAADAARTRIAA